jgi:hypothetical protein
MTGQVGVDRFDQLATVSDVAAEGALPRPKAPQHNNNNGALHPAALVDYRLCDNFVPLHISGLVGSTLLFWQDHKKPRSSFYSVA